jgi:hypothetical protein
VVAIGVGGGATVTERVNLRLTDLFGGTGLGVGTQSSLKSPDELEEEEEDAMENTGELGFWQLGVSGIPYAGFLVYVGLVGMWSLPWSLIAAAFSITCSMYSVLGSRSETSKTLQESGALRRQNA